MEGEFFLKMEVQISSTGAATWKHQTLNFSQTSRVVIEGVSSSIISPIRTEWVEDSVISSSSTTLHSRVVVKRL